MSRPDPGGPDDRPAPPDRPGHLDERGRARMVDVSGKEPSLRTATAEAAVLMPARLLEIVAGDGAPKGDVLAVARLAGIAAAKRTGELIPLAHPVALHHVAVELVPEPEAGRLRIEATARARDRTGVEMEAMTAAAVAALTVYDMLKGLERGLEIASIRLLAKEGGRSGPWRREGGRSPDGEVPA